MKILVTGSNGFVGKNLVTTLKTYNDFIVYEYDLDNTIEDLKKYTKDCDFVVHLAGINRPTKPEEFYEGNAGFTETLCKYLKVNQNNSPILISSSIQACLDNDYGKSKKEGEEMLLKHAEFMNSKVYIYRLANLFGKWCRPNYNSVVATWCYNIANGVDIQINNPDTVLDLCYIDDVIREFICAINNDANIGEDGYCHVLPTYSTKLGELANTLYSFRDSRKNYFVVSMENSLHKKLYSTYLSYLNEKQFSYPLKMNIDNRGSFTEFLKTKNFGQVSINISKPGIVKGNHWHHTKTEKFLVISGQGLIQFRKIGSNEIIEYHVSGDKLEVIDIPTGYTHNIINEGKNDMVTVMWANEIFDPEHPDTFYEEV